MKAALWVQIYQNLDPDLDLDPSRFKWVTYIINYKKAVANSFFKQLILLKTPLKKLYQYKNTGNDKWKNVFMTSFFQFLTVGIRVQIHNTDP